MAQGSVPGIPVLLSVRPLPRRMDLSTHLQQVVRAHITQSAVVEDSRPVVGRGSMDVHSPPPPYTVCQAGDLGPPSAPPPPDTEEGERPPSYAQSQMAATSELPSAGPKTLPLAYLLGIPLGLFGAHHFYLGRRGFGVLYLCTLGLLGFGWLTDLCRMNWLVREANLSIRKPQHAAKRSREDAYTLWFSPLGLLGFHNYYLNRPGWGILCTLTLSLFGVLWVYDFVKIPLRVKQTNRSIEQRRFAESILGVSAKSLNKAMALGVSPLGVFGAHHFYLERYSFGLLYCMTFGLLGIGWLGDMVRMKILVQRANLSRINRLNPYHRHLDDAYFTLFPLGIIGLHQFYLYRPGWGVVYFCTFGFFGLAWLMDFFKLPRLVKEANALYAGELQDELPNSQYLQESVEDMMNVQEIQPPQEVVILSPPSYEEVTSTNEPISLTRNQSICDTSGVILSPSAVSISGDSS